MTFIGAGEWRLNSISAKVHRLASSGADQLDRPVGWPVGAENYVSWLEFSRMIAGTVKVTFAQDDLASIGDFAEFLISPSGGRVNVYSGDGVRTEFPGRGDVWDISFIGG